MRIKISKKCPCGKLFYFYPSPTLIKRKKYCSKKCFYKFRPKVPCGLKHVFVTPCKTWFKKGSVPWHKDTRGILKANSGSFKKGQHYSPKTEFKKGENLGEKNRGWKGDNVGYHALHTWVQRMLGKAQKCEFCGTTKEKKRIDWANKSHEYKRELSDWISLCSKCHGKYDTNNRGFIKKKYGKDFK